MTEELHVVQRLPIPAERHAELYERLHLGGEVDRAVMDRVVHRLDAEPVARSEQRTVTFVPDGERELTSQRVEGACAVLFEQMQCDLAVRSGSEHVALPLELRPNPLEVVELAIHDNSQPAVLVHYRLIAGR